MKTIEERAYDYADEKWGDIDEYHADTVAVSAYIAGAEEQKDIDDAKLLKLKSAWEKQAQINHDDEANYKQGYHDAIQKAYKWIKANTEGGVHPQNAYGFADRFLKMMEE